MSPVMQQNITGKEWKSFNHANHGSDIYYDLSASGLAGGVKPLLIIFSFLLDSHFLFIYFFQVRV
ncbi:MAG: hypothetical protein ACYCVH_13545 [Ignavibacteriaceae bacterium]